MTDPQKEVEILAQYLHENPECTEEAVLAALIRAGVPSLTASNIYCFTQSAWSRALLANSGVIFSDEYIIANELGEIITRGTLSSEPHFIAASKIAPAYRQSDGFLRLVAGSSEYSAIEQMERTGKDPREAKSAPQIRFTGEVTPEAINKVLAQLYGQKAPRSSAIEDALAEHRRASTSEAAAKKRPWWKFW